MRNNKPLIILLALVALLMLALGAFYLYLVGGQRTTEERVASDDTGIVHIRSIYTYGDGQPIRRPVGVAADEDGGFFVTLRDDAKVVEFDRDGDYVRSWGEHGAQPGQLMSPLGVAVDRLAGHVYVMDRARLRLICYDTEGEFLWEVPLLAPLSGAAGQDGELFITTFGPLVKTSSEGEVLSQVGTRGKELGQFDFPRQVAVDDEGHLYVADTNNTRIQKVEMSGELTATVLWHVGEPPRFQDDPDTRFIVPSGIALDEDGRVVVLDGFKHTIDIFDAETGEEVHTFPERRGSSDGLFNLPTGIAHLGDDYFAVTDTFNDRVQIIRILTPEKNTVLARNPWMRWFGLLLLLPLLMLFGRRRVFVTREALARALEEDSARLLIAVYRKLHVLPEVEEAFKDFEEEGVRLGDYLVSVGERAFAEKAGAQDASASVADGWVPTPGSPVSGGGVEEEARLARAAEPTRLERLLLRRHRVLCSDAAQCERMADAGVKTIAYERLKESYSLED
ncbi:MAG: hypothetical protein Kow0056_06510 [Coriobacteriia bacterium]